MTKSVLVIFEKVLPKKTKKWWNNFSSVIAPGELKDEISAKGIAFEAIEHFVGPGDIQKASKFLNELTKVKLHDDGLVTESIIYKGFELWWSQYDDLFYKYCLPYTQYESLLCHLENFDSVTLYGPKLSPKLFSIYLQTHGVDVITCKEPKSFPPIGIWLQILISLISWPILALRRPSAMVYTGDLFDPPNDYSFRMKLIYEELRSKKIPFVEFIRSMESSKKMLSHAFIRRRPVIYSYAIKVILSWFSNTFFKNQVSFDELGNKKDNFKFALATIGVQNSRGMKWSIKIMNILVKSIGVRAAIIPAVSSRTFSEVLGCRLSGIPSIGILHGAASRYYNVYDFIPEYRGEKCISLDKYGLWSQSWKDYYLKYGRIYSSEQLEVSGPMRPLQKKEESKPFYENENNDVIKVLLVPGELSDPQEILMYIKALMEDKNIALYITFRPYRDAFEEWLQKNNPEFLNKIPKERVFRGRNINQDISNCDIVVGTYSTAVLEALLQLKPLVFFNTVKWGDYFDLENYDKSKFFAKDSTELIKRIKENKRLTCEELKKLQERFFGDPHMNGSKWVVDQLEKELLKGRATR